jgi:hypothetical protein
VQEIKMLYREDTPVVMPLTVSKILKHPNIEV